MLMNWARVQPRQLYNRISSHAASLRRVIRPASSLSLPATLRRASHLTSASYKPYNLESNKRFAMEKNVYGNFDLVKRVPVEGTNITLSKWQSRLTGLSVVHIDYEAPIVKGYFAVATEIFNDTGCPHTLEHLVFMGSKKYPYKGVLDNLANRAFSEGTNAWTDTDNTVYTVSTAGQQGFLQLLPIYVDHILYPTMTESGFVTEVHHIDGKGEDSGVVYSEMQGRENTSWDLMALEAQREMYPADSAYRSETGGLMEALRALNVETIRNYHGSYYVPQNLCLIVAGSLSTQSLLDTLHTHVEPTIVAHGQANGPRPNGWKRPFLETPSAKVPKISQIQKKTVEFPEKDESSGELMLRFVGPHPNDFLTLKAIDILGIYLTDTAAAPLTKEFVEIPEPLCTEISFTESTRATYSELAVSFSAVPVEHLEDLDSKFRTSLERISKDGIDMARMSTIITRDTLKHKSAIENSGGDVYSYTVISDFLYGDTNGNDILGAVTSYNDTLKSWSSQQWTEILQKYYVGSSYIAIRGKPSAALADKLETDEKARVAKQVEKLGPEGLAKLEQDLANAKKEHEIPIPENVLTDFPVPEIGSISWITVQSAKNDPKDHHVEKLDQTALVSASALQKYIEQDKVDLNLTVNYDHVASDFVTVHGFMSLSQLPNELRPYLLLYTYALFSLPVDLADGKRLSHEEVINALDKDTISYSCGLGFDGFMSELGRISIKVEKTKYALGISWLQDVIYGSVFTKDRLEVTLAKVQQNLPQLKRDGNTVNSSVVRSLLYDDTSTSLYGEILKLAEWVPKIASELKDNPQSVIEKLEKVREIITKPEAFRFAVGGSVTDLAEPRSAWVKNFKSLPTSEPLPLKWSRDSLTSLGKNPAQKAVIMSMPTIESSFATHIAKGFTGYTHEDYAALKVALEVLDGTESFLWKYIRGSGLAYGAYTSMNTESGFVTFSLYRSPNSYKGFVEASKVVKGLCDGSIELKQTAVDAAKSSLVFSMTKSVSSPSRAALASFINQAIKGISQTWQQEMLEKFNAVTTEQVLAALRKWVLPLFDPATSIAVIASAPGKVDEIAAGLTDAGFEVEKRRLDVSPEELAAAAEEEGSDGSESDGTESEDGGK